MKAVRMYEPRDLRVEEAPVPKIEKDEVLVSVQAVGICGSDIPRANQYGAHVSPIILGHEFSGVITQKGSAVKKFEIGAHVTVPPLVPCQKCHWCQIGAYSLCDDYDYYGSRRDGAMAEYIAVKESNLLKLADDIAFEDGATIDPCANALHAMAKADFKEGDSICLCGAGPIGLFAAQYAKRKGASKIIVVDIWDEKLDIAKKIGVDVVINSKKEDMTLHVKEATGGIGADIVIDFTGAPIAQAACIRCARKQGHVVFLGISHQGLQLSKQDVDYIMRGELSVGGSWNSFTSPFPGNDWTESIRLYEKHEFTAQDVISHRLNLEEVPEVFEKIAEGNYFFNKIMIFPQGK
ncbi:galactitol-1-phosphate 5-dehydrogenase [Lachnospiraceae bacterium ZAX-1]